MDKTYTLQQAADYLGISLNTMRHIAGREIPIIYGIDRQRQVTQKSLDDYMKTNAYRTLPRYRRAAPQPEQELEHEYQIPNQPNGKPLLGMVPPKTQTIEPRRDAAGFAHVGRLAEGPNGSPKREALYPTRPAEKDTIIHTDNAEVVKWLERKGIRGAWLTGSLTIKDVEGKHLITGICPNYIQAAARTVTVIRAMGLYIKEATVQDLEASARLVTYTPPTETTSIWE